MPKREHNNRAPKPPDTRAQGTPQSNPRSPVYRKNLEKLYKGKITYDEFIRGVRNSKAAS